jgi:adenylate kinase
MAVVFVAGVHGVGKTTTCRYVSDVLGITSYTASQIIRNGKISGVTDIEKTVADLDDNQRVLIDGVRHVLNMERRFLLDGHFTLKTNRGIEAIPLRVFELLSICGIVIFTDDPLKIATRIGERDKTECPVEFVEVHQNAEVSHARFVAESLKIPLKILNAFDTRGLLAAIVPWI